MGIKGRPAESTEQRAVGVSKVNDNLVAGGVRLVKNSNDCRAKFQDNDQRGRIAAADADNLFCVDDSEVVGYLNNAKEIHYKKIIWEKMNKDFAKGNDKLYVKKRKREIGGKKDVHAKKSAKTTEEIENKTTSSRINYSALQKLTDELKQVPVEAELGLELRANSDSAENLKNGFHEFEQENEYGEDDDSFKDDDDDDSYYGYGTEYYNNSEDFAADY